MQGTLGLTDGERLWAVRYSTEHRSRSLFVSQDVETLRQLHPESERLRELSDDARIVVSEPVSDLPGAWLEVPESSAVLVQPGPDQQVPFTPQHPSAVTSRPRVAPGAGAAHTA